MTVSEANDRPASRIGGQDGRGRDDRRLEQLLQEVRVAMPGVQVLFGFLLAVPFQARFDEITEFQRITYFGTLLSAAAATALFVAPVAFHRLTFRQGHKAYLVRWGSRMAIAGLLALGLAMNGVVLLVTDLLFRSATVIVTAAAVGVLYVWLWLGAAVLRRRAEEES